VYGNRKSKYDIIKNITNYNIDKSKGLRYLYAYIKATYEQKFNDLLNLYNSPLFSFKVIRPFNIIGQNQKRGVLFEMIKSAVLNKKIKYNKDTTRTFTGIDYASSKAVDVIISSGSYSVNVSDTRCSITLEQLANIVKNVLNIDC
jgi:nucleoside-diphosphate-sugar epimerase